MTKKRMPIIALLVKLKDKVRDSSVLYFLFVIAFSAFVLYSNIATDYSLAKKAFKQRNYYEAIPLLENMMKENPYHLQAGTLLVDSYIALNNNYRAKVVLEKLTKFHPRNVKVLERIMQIALIEKRYKDVQKYVSLTRSIDDKNYYSYYSEGYILEEKGYYARAIDHYRRSIRYNENFIDANIALAYLYLSRNEKEKAYRLFQKMVSTHPTHERPYYHLANYYYITGDYTKALSELSKALHYYKDYSKAKLLEAEIYTEQKKYEAAIAIIKEMDEREVGGDKNYTLAILYERNKDYENATKRFEEYLNRNPDELFARIAYERVLFKTVGTTHPKRVSASKYYLYYAEKYQNENDFLRAEIYYKRALRLYPTDVKTRKKLAELYKNKGYFEKYYEQLLIVADLAPGNNRIDSIIEYRGRDIKKLPSRKHGISQYEITNTKTKIAIFSDFKMIKGEHLDLEKAIAEIIAHNLHQFPKIEVLELYTKSFKTKEKAELLRKNNVNYFLTGRIVEYEDALNIELDLVDVRTRRIEKTYRSHKSGKQKIIETAYKLTKDINKDTMLFGKIIKIAATDLIIDIGKNQGVTNGMIFNVYKTRYPIFDFESKSIVADENDIVGKMQIKTLDENLSVGAMLNEQDFSHVRYKSYVVPFYGTNEE